MTCTQGGMKSLSRPLQRLVNLARILREYPSSLIERFRLEQSVLAYRQCTKEDPERLAKADARRERRAALKAANVAKSVAGRYAR